MLTLSREPRNTNFSSLLVIFTLSILLIVKTDLFFPGFSHVSIFKQISFHLLSVIVVTKIIDYVMHVSKKTLIRGDLSAGTFDITV